MLPERCPGHYMSDISDDSGLVIAKTESSTCTNAVSVRNLTAHLQSIQCNELVLSRLDSTQSKGSPHPYVAFTREEIRGHLKWHELKEALY